MVLLQIKLTDKANLNAGIFKLKNKLKTKEEAINKILEDYKEK